MKIIMFENLNYEILRELNNETFQIIYGDINFYFKAYLKDKSNKIIFFSNGAVNRKTKTPPVFMRSSWSEDFESNCIFIDDRTIHENNLNIGWGVGTKERHFLADISQITKRISNILNVQSSNVFYYGSSAGGFMSMILASKHRETTAIVNNPQTSVLDFNKGFVDKLCNAIFPNMDKEEIKRIYSERLNVEQAFLVNDNIPRIFYLQNRKCQRDMETQYHPFLRKVRQNNIDEELFTYILYNDHEADHNPLRRTDTVRVINKIIE